MKYSTKSSSLLEQQMRYISKDMFLEKQKEDHHHFTWLACVLTCLSHIQALQHDTQKLRARSDQTLLQIQAAEQRVRIFLMMYNALDVEQGGQSDLRTIFSWRTPQKLHMSTKQSRRSRMP